MYSETRSTALQIGVESQCLQAVTEAAQPIPSNSKIIDLDPSDTSDDEHWIKSPSLWPVTEAAQPIPGNSKIIDLDSLDTSDDKHWISMFWEKNKWPSGLPSIQMIFDPIDHLEKPAQQQQPQV